MKDFDLVIVGASFAGLACARTAALRGLSVCVIDSKPEPGARVRTTGILVKEATDDFDVPAHLMRKVRGVRLYAPDGRALDLSATGYYSRRPIRRSSCVGWRPRRNSQGPLCASMRASRTPKKPRDGILLAQLGLKTRFLIGADGARSGVAERFRLGRNRRFLVAAEMECETIAKIDPRFLHCFADSRLAPGYIGWVVPGHGVTQIGIAARQRRKPALNTFIDRMKQRFGFNRLHIVQRRSGLIPTGGPVAPLGRGRVLLIGDAAGLVSPLTGGGIHTALSFGRRAAQLVSDYLLDRGPHPAPTFAGEIPRYPMKRLLRTAFDLAPNFAFNAMLMTSPARALAQRIYFHRRGGGTDSFETWAEALARDDMSPAAPQRGGPELRCI